MQCLGKTKTGSQCTKITKDITKYCHLHKSQYSEIKDEKIDQLCNKINELKLEVNDQKDQKLEVNDQKLEQLYDQINELKLESEIKTVLNIDTMSDLEEALEKSDTNKILEYTKLLIIIPKDYDMNLYIKYIKDAILELNPDYWNELALNLISLLDSMINYKNTVLENEKIKIALESL